MPNFLIIGAGRSGTTSLYYYLKQHPQIFMSPIKETNFFAYDGQKLDGHQPGKSSKHRLSPIKSIEAYQALFKKVSTEKAIGEASPRYLWYPPAAKHIKYHLPQVKLIAVLRHPVERAYSAYLKYVRDGQETRPFSQAIHNHQADISDGVLPIGAQHYIDIGFYYRHLKRYFDLFDRNQIAVYLFEDLQSDAIGLLQNIFRWLEVDDGFVPNMSIQYNASGRPKNEVLHSVLQPSPVTATLKKYLPARLLRLPYTYLINLYNKNLAKPSLSPEMRQKLLVIYREDTLQLQQLTQRDLSNWLKC